MADLRRTGGGDPRKTLALLWDGPTPSSRGPRAALGVEQIVDTAIALADRDGLGVLSMRKVAEQLGAGTMSLYRHVPGKGELLDLMYERVLGELPTPDPALGGWRERLEAHANASLAHYHRHPWLLDMVAGDRPPLGPNVLDAYEAQLAIMRETGLTGAECNAAVSMVSHYVAGAAREATAAARVEQETGITHEQWWKERETFWEERFDPARYPAISAIYEEGGFDAALDGFAFGLGRMLDGLEQLVRARAG